MCQSCVLWFLEYNWCFLCKEESSLSLPPVNLSVIVAVQREKPETFIVSWLASGTTE